MRKRRHAGLPWQSRWWKVGWRLLRVPPRLAYKIGLRPVAGRFILLLTTTGRKTGLPRVTPLQYEEVDGEIYVASARGQEADWFQNVQHNPDVIVRLKGRTFRGLAEPVTDVARIADFLELRLARHPRMVGAIMRGAGLAARPTREQLEGYAARRAMVIIRPYEDGGRFQPAAASSATS
jgi:deazaflavin-dependent oxidoreductase (nitroreductase family)